MNVLSPAPPTRCYSCDCPLEGLAILCPQCEPVASESRDTQGGESDVATSRVLSDEQFETTLEYMRWWMPRKRRAEFDRAVRKAEGWANSQGVTFPWAPREALAYAVWLLVSNGAMTAVSERRGEPWTGQPMHYETFSANMRAVDRWHSVNQAAEPWTQARDWEFSTEWKNIRSEALTRERRNQKDAVLLTHLLAILRHLNDPGARQARDAALMGILCDPSLQIGSTGSRPTSAFLASVTMADVELGVGPDGRGVAISGTHRGRSCTLLLPPGATADAVAVLVLQVQGRDPDVLAARGIRGFVRDTSMMSSQPVFRKVPCGPTAEGLGYAGIRRAAITVASAHLMVERPRRLPDLTPYEVDACVRAELGRVSLRTALDAAWLSGGWWVAGRGMEMLALQRHNVRVADTHLEFHLLRKASRDAGELPFLAPHLEVPWADPVFLLRRALWMVHQQLQARGDEAALQAFTMGKQWLLPSDIRSLKATDRVGEYNTRLQRYARKIDLRGPTGAPLDLGTHSLRAGLINTAFMVGMDLQKIMLHTDHRTVDNILLYARRAQLEPECSLPNDMLFKFGVGGRDPDNPPIIADVQRIFRFAFLSGERCQLPACQAMGRVDFTTFPARGAADRHRHEDSLWRRH